MRILVTGSTAYDVLLGYDGSFADGLTEAKEALSVVYLTSHFARHHGGTAANIGWNLDLLGLNPLIVSTVGSDGGPYKALLNERGIDTSYIEQLDNDVTSTAIIGADNVEHQIGFFHPGADQHGTWPDLNQERDSIAYAIISPREERVMVEGIDWCKKFGVPYIFDPGQRITSMPTDTLHRSIDGSAGLIANEYEWGVIKDKLNLTEENVMLMTPLLVVTQGENGVTYFDSTGGNNVGPCKPDKVINPTGAGDAFRAGLLAGLSSGWGLRDCMRLGNAMGSLAVELEGTLLDSLDKEAVFVRASETYGENLPSLS